MLSVHNIIKPEQLLEQHEEPSGQHYALVLLLSYVFVNFVGYDFYEKRRPSVAQSIKFFILRPFFMFTEFLNTVKYNKHDEIDEYIGIVYSDIAYYRLTNNIPMIRDHKIEDEWMDKYRSKRNQSIYPNRDNSKSNENSND